MHLADLRIERRDAVVVATVSGEIDMSNAIELGDALLTSIVNADHGLILDLRAVRYLDSAAIHVLFDMRQQLGHRSQALRLVVDGHSTGRDALEVAGVLDALPFSADVDEAVSEVAAAHGA